MRRWLRWLDRGERPNVLIDFVLEEGCLHLVLENHGAAPAHHVSTAFEPSFTGVDGRCVMPDRHLFAHVGFLPPGKELRAFVDTAAAYFDREEPTEIRTTVSFEDDVGRAYENHACHDLEIYRTMPHRLPDDRPGRR